MSLALLSFAATSFQLNGAAPARLQRAAPAVAMSATRIANGAAAAALALALSGDMHMTPPAAMAAPPAVVQQVGTTSLLAADTADLTDEQKAFLKEREKMATKYEMRTESTFKSADEVKDKKNVYTAIVGGLIVVAFVAPMVQFFWYTGGE